MSKALDYPALLALARKEANREFRQSWPPIVHAEMDSVRKKLVVRKFLERICPIPVEEAL